jgi:hypothetical protein
MESESVNDNTNTTTAINVTFNSRHLLALYTTTERDKGSHTRSVYVVPQQPRDNTLTLTLIDSLQFHLYVAVPPSLDIHLLCEEMLMWYGKECYGFGAKNRLSRALYDKGVEIHGTKKRLAELSGSGDVEMINVLQARLVQQQKERAVMSAKMVTLENGNALYTRMLRMITGGGFSKHDDDDSDDSESDDNDDLPNLPPSHEKMEWIRAELGKMSPHFYPIKTLQRFEVAANARLCEKKLKDHTAWRFTFDNHTVLQFFVNKFRHSFEIGGSTDHASGIRKPGVEYHVHVLHDDSKEPVLLSEAHYKNTSLYVLHQCVQFPHANYEYRWEWSNNEGRSTLKSGERYGCVEPPFVGNNNAKSHSYDICSDAVAIMDRLANNNIGAMDRRDVTPCPILFLLNDLSSNLVVHRVSMDERRTTLSLLKAPSVAKSSKKKRGADDHDEEGKGPVVKKVALSVAKPKINNLPGQKKVLQQGRIAFLCGAGDT